MNRKTLVLPALAALLVPILSGCGGVESQDSGGEAIVVGTTDRFSVDEDSPAPFDPAAAYDIASWNVMRSTFQTLLRPPRSGTEPVPEAAEKCEFTDKQGEQYRCTLRSDLTFSNGNALTAEDVEFSINRMLDIGEKLGPASLLNNLDKVETAGENEVVFHLKKPDATFPFKLATPAAAIVDSEVYPRNGYLEGTEVVGSGAYVLSSYDQSAAVGVFERNPEYRGTLEIENERIELRTFDSAENMEKALQKGSVDVMSRTLTPEQVLRLEHSDSGVDLVESPGQEIRYLVFDTDAPVAGQDAVRRAMAQVIDRKKLVRDVYQRTTDPLYSIVPTGLLGHRNSFFNEYGDPDVPAARDMLEEAGVDTPVRMTLNYTTDHYGAVTEREFETLQQQLNSTGLFEVDIEGTPWSKFRPSATGGKYEVYGFGWFPDFPDADNFMAPFFAKDNFLQTPYVDEEIRDRIIPQTRRETNRAAAGQSYGRAQDVVAEDVPVLPLWQGNQYIAVRDGITGAEWALNSASVMQLWELGRGVAG
ncbi:ABC transporter substrate-binding protein [Streptomyces sp. TR06-5]|uniref:ABC transporter substrate-binding protein n=1 Tax=unclassified Streptomyces TaxID=2593676 RepID=UPI0039A002EC